MRNTGTSPAQSGKQNLRGSHGLDRHFVNRGTEVLNMEITQDIVREYLHYAEQTGIFTLKKRWSTKGVSPVGTVLGYKDGKGHIHFSFFGKKYKAHRLAWLYMHGVWPTDQVDHINGVKDDNRISNLREVNNSQNQWNRHKINSSSGYKGVFFNKKNRSWYAQFNKIYLGTFHTPEAAARAYDAFVLKLHPEYAATNAIIRGVVDVEEEK